MHWLSIAIIAGEMTAHLHCVYMAAIARARQPRRRDDGDELPSSLSSRTNTRFAPTAMIAMRRAAMDGSYSIFNFQFFIFNFTSSRPQSRD
jgi:hypothetical protein